MEQDKPIVGASFSNLPGIVLKEPFAHAPTVPPRTKKKKRNVRLLKLRCISSTHCSPIVVGYYMSDL